MTIRSLKLAFGLLAIAPLCAAAPPHPAHESGPEQESRGSSILVQGAKLERVFNGGFYLEGPAQGPDGRIFFSDITQSWRAGMAAGIVWVHDPRTGKTGLFRSPSGMSNGLVFDHQGRLIAAHGADFGARYVSRTDMASGKTTIVAGLYNGRPFNSPNDVDIDAKDRIYFTDPRYFGFEPVEQPVFGVYRIDADGKVSLILADAARPNGVAVSPDQKSLYITENEFFLGDRRIPAGVPWRAGDMKLVRYNLSPDGTVSNRRVLVDYGSEGGGGPDGIEVDRAGNIYVAVLTKDPGIRVYSPGGAELARVATPQKPTNLTLAQVNGVTWLYITAGSSLYRIQTTSQLRD